MASPNCLVWHQSTRVPPTHYTVTMATGTPQPQQYMTHIIFHKLSLHFISNALHSIGNGQRWLCLNEVVRVLSLQRKPHVNSLFFREFRVIPSRLIERSEGPRIDGLITSDTPVTTKPQILSTCKTTVSLPKESGNRCWVYLIWGEASKLPAIDPVTEHLTDFHLRGLLSRHGGWPSVVRFSRFLSKSAFGQ